MLSKKFKSLMLDIVPEGLKTCFGATFCFSFRLTFHNSRYEIILLFNGLLKLKVRKEIRKICNTVCNLPLGVRNFYKSSTMLLLLLLQHYTCYTCIICHFVLFMLLLHP